jgi:hypothetical protein
VDIRETVCEANHRGASGGSFFFFKQNDELSD